MSHHLHITAYFAIFHYSDETLLKMACKHTCRFPAALAEMFTYPSFKPCEMSETNLPYSRGGGLSVSWRAFQNKSSTRLGGRGGAPGRLALVVHQPLANQIPAGHTGEGGAGGGFRFIFFLGYNPRF